MAGGAKKRKQGNAPAALPEAKRARKATEEEEDDSDDSEFDVNAVDSDDQRKIFFFGDALALPLIRTNLVIVDGEEGSDDEEGDSDLDMSDLDMESFDEEDEEEDEEAEGSPKGKHLHTFTRYSLRLRISF